MSSFDTWFAELYRAPYSRINENEALLKAAYAAGMLAAAEIARDLRVPAYTVDGGRSTAPSHIEIGIAIKAKAEAV